MHPRSIFPRLPHFLRRVFRRPIVKIISGACVLFLGGIFSIGIYIGVHAVAARTSLLAAQDAFATYDFSAASLALTDAAFSLERIERATVFTHTLSYIPGIARPYNAGVALVETGVTSLRIASQALTLARDVVAALDRTSSGSSFSFLDDPRPYSSFSTDERRALVRALAKSAQSLFLLRIDILLVSQDIARIHAPDLLFSDLVRTVERVQEVFPRVLRAVNVLIPFSQVAGAFLGIDAPAHFLVVYFNTGELRPGGGFIGAYSLVSLEDGFVTSFSSHDSYYPDDLVADDATYVFPSPLPISRYLGISTWFFRDAAWSPDFFLTASLAREFLLREFTHAGEQVPEVTHVVGITPEFISSILRFFGSVTVDGITYTSENFYDLLEYDVEIGYAARGLAITDRKQPLQNVSSVLLERIFALSPSSWFDFFVFLLREIERKHVVFMSTDTHTQAVLEDAGWSGSVPAFASDDALMLVDANLGALKTDRVMRREIAYGVTQTADRRYVATTQVTYIHSGVVDWRTTGYASYTRLFVPLHAELIEVQGFDTSVDVAEEEGMTTFGGYFVVDPGETYTVTYRYFLPDTVARAIDRGVYTLGVFKQIGSGDNPLTLMLDFGTNVVAAEPAEDEEFFGDASYDYTGFLSSDLFFRITL